MRENFIFIFLLFFILIFFILGYKFNLLEEPKDFASSRLDMARGLNL